ncbi:hypothetical protein SAMN05444156_2751 [Verrucomicrobium sp. GAS474]|uniref:hypothetical protein n=1 Tax=Verrucomicrobium sp. GAS474 TaxID=1882831 RepID=UPI0008793EED|nr:hypothetical protein [Verrucomicrobium sp. GAS474]SDU23225.1 hypothetical protein SAMN05444156_2751 [Verrucomicrobium sp. GAS474]
MNPFFFLRSVRRWFSQPTEAPAPVPSPFRRQTEAWGNARVLVRCFYAGLVYLAASLIPGWEGIVGRVPVAPLWPVAWLHSGEGITAILSLYLFGAIAALAFPEQRWARAAAFVGVLEYVAYGNSFGKIGHSMHGWVLVSLIFVLLPRGGFTERNRAVRQQFLHVVWLATFLLLYIYFMSGMSKVGGCLWQLWNGETSVLNPYSLSNQIADRLNQTQTSNAVAVWLIDHHWVGWILYLGVIYLQIAALWAAFRPELLRPVGLAMILFHVGTYFIFTIVFLPMVLLAGLLLLVSPWAGAGSTDLGRTCWGRLPGVGVTRFLFRRMANRG